MIELRHDSSASTLYEEGGTPLSESVSIDLKDRDQYPSTNPLVHNSEKIPHQVRQQLLNHGLDVTNEGMVYWTDDASDFPRNWNISRKAYDTFMVVFFELIATIFSNTGTSSAYHAMDHFYISRELSIFSFTTTYLLAQAIGSIILPPYTETFGRRPSYIIASALYSVCCVIVAGLNSLAGVIVGRFFCGFFSAVPGTVAAGSLEDLWDVRARIWVYNLWTTCAVFGLGIGPVMATYIGTSHLGWFVSGSKMDMAVSNFEYRQWTFWIAAISTAATTVFAFFMRECRPFCALKLKMVHIRKANKDITFPELYCENQEHAPSLKTFAITCLARPIRLFFTEPIVLTITLICSFVYATIYLFTEAIRVVYSDFGLSTRHSSLVNLAFSIGPIFSLLTQLCDIRISNKRTQTHKTLLPEDKLVGFYVSAPLLAIAGWWFAWTVPPAVTTVSPFVSMAALILVGFACNEYDYVLSGYLTDTYSTWASSANAPLAFMRGTLGGVFPLFGGLMFEGLGGNVAGSILAAITTFYCFIAFGFWKYGKTIREKSRAADS